MQDGMLSWGFGLERYLKLRLKFKQLGHSNSVMIFTFFFQVKTDKKFASLKQITINGIALDVKTTDSFV